jgi:A/G-specific adenine glycosylase
MSAKNLAPLRRRLLCWYDKNKRDLPWRKTKDPYAIWVAETMLQQTQVRTVIPYYGRFLEAFPTVEALGRAPQQRILRMWSGLGYYRRAENLKQAARQLVRRCDGKIPRNHDVLRALPGVGDYTAGAVLSIAYQQRYPALDGNARRVLSRLYNLTDNTELHSRALRLVPRSRPGDFNQALMELGATLCVPRGPDCAACPVAADCAARSGNHLAAVSQQRSATAIRAVTWPLAIVHHSGKLLLRRRAAKGLLAHLWEFPGGEAVKRNELETTLRWQLRALPTELSTGRKIGEFRHAITYRRIRAPIYLFDYHPATEMRFPAPHWRWIQRSHLTDYPMSSMTRKALRVFDIYEKSLS